MREFERIATGILAEAAQKAGEAENNAGDYTGSDGLLHCGKCHKPKEKILEFPGSLDRDGTVRRMKVRCMCDCETAAREEMVRREKGREEMQQLQRLRDSSLIESRLRAARLSSFVKTRDNQNLYMMAHRYVEKFEDMYKKSQGILFWGTVGTGKSFTAACIANELLDRMVPVIMTSFVKILQNIQGASVDEAQYIAQLNRAKLLIIDDLGTERNTDYALEKVYNVIDSRYLSGKPLILTTNLTLPEMQEAQDTRYKRIYDRIFEMCYPFRVYGDSWRMGQAAQRFEDMRSILEG